MREIRRILKPDGVLYLGIENRYALSDLLGLPEGHVGLPWVGVLPRPVAEVYCRALRKGSFRVYTHGRANLANMLAQSKFESSHFYAPFPVYRRFNQIVDLENPERMVLSISFLRRKKLLRFAVQLAQPVIKRRFTRRWLYKMVPAFSVIAQTTSASQSAYIERAIQWIEDCLGTEANGQVEIDCYLVRDEVVVVLTADRSDSRGGWAVRLPLGERGRSACAQSMIASEWVHNSGEIPPTLAGKFPRVLFAGDFEGQRIHVEERFQGEPAVNHILSSRYDTILDNALTFLHELQAATAKKRLLDDALFWELVESKVQKLATCLDDPQSPQFFGDVLTFLRGHLLNRDVILTWSHGDYNPGNILVNREGDLAGVLDLNHSQSLNFPLLDALQLLLYRYRYKGDLHFGESIVRVACPQAFLPSDQCRLDDCLVRYGLSEAGYMAMVLLHWINHLHGHIDSMASYSRRWLWPNFVEPSRALRDWLKDGSGEGDAFGDQPK